MRESGLAKPGENPRAEGMLKPVRDKNEGEHRCGARMTAVTPACPTLQLRAKLTSFARRWKCRVGQCPQICTQRSPLCVCVSPHFPPHVLYSLLFTHSPLVVIQINHWVESPSRLSSPLLPLRFSPWRAFLLRKDSSPFFPRRMALCYLDFPLNLIHPSTGVCY